MDVTATAANLVTKVIMPLAGTYGAITSKPLGPLLGVVYLVMMGLLPASVIEKFLRINGKEKANAPDA